MRSNGLRMIVAACVVAVIYGGCATDQKTGGSTSAAMTADRGKGSGQSPDGKCAWEFDKATGSDQLKKNTLKLTVNQGFCTVDESIIAPLYITQDKSKFYQIKDANAAYFETDGSCRYCYINNFGGMSCVVYPGC